MGTQEPTKVVSEMLGHANLKSTLDVYSHVMQEDFAEPLAEMAGKFVALCCPKWRESNCGLAILLQMKGFGEPGRTRTSNPLIKSQLLYH
jgi:hypothetical protein